MLPDDASLTRLRYVNRLTDVHHTTRIDCIAAALHALGKWLDLRPVCEAVYPRRRRRPAARDAARREGRRPSFAPFRTKARCSRRP